MINGQNLVLVKLALICCVFLIKLENGRTWPSGLELFFSSDPEYNCSGLNFTNCTICTPGTIYNSSNKSLFNSLGVKKKISLKQIALLENQNCFEIYNENCKKRRRRMLLLSNPEYMFSVSRVR